MWFLIGNNLPNIDPVIAYIFSGAVVIHVLQGLERKYKVFKCFPALESRFWEPEKTIQLLKVWNKTDRMKLETLLISPDPAPTPAKLDWNSFNISNDLNPSTRIVVLNALVDLIYLSFSMRFFAWTISHKLVLHFT